MVRLVAALALASAPLAASAQDFRFSGFAVEGNQRIEAATITAFAGIQPGATVSAAELNAAGQRIRESGLFERVEIEPRGGTLVIRVEEFPTVNRVVFEGNRRLSDDDLLRVVSSTPRRVYTPATAEADAEAITAAYAQQGRLAATVTPRIIRRADNRVDLVFEVFEGGLVEIERISFVGNRSYSERRLRRELETKQAGLLRTLVRRDTFLEDRIAFDRQLLTDFYRARGYVDFEVLSVDVALTEERDAFLVTFQLREGQQFRIGEVSVTSDLPDVDAEGYQGELAARTGDVYSPVAVDNTITRLERRALRDGLDFVRAEPRVTRNDRELTLDLEFVLSRGPRIFVERIDIEGNTTTLDRVVRREFDIVEGDPFNPREIRASAERIRALGFFSSTDVTAREGSTPSQVVVDVDVQEQPTGSLSFGGNFSTEAGFALVASFSERNFLGRGQALSFGINSGEDNRQFTFSFTEPYFLGRDVAASLAFAYRTTDNLNALYDTETLRFAPSFSFPVSENGRMTLRAFADATDITGVNDDASTLIKQEADLGQVVVGGLGYRYSFDNRRSGLLPETGVVLRFGQDFGVGEDVQYAQTSALVGAERSIFNEEITLRATLEGGALIYNEGASRVTDRYFLGSRIMRGFEPGGIGPRDADTDDALGGNYFAVARFEADFPIGLPEEYGITGGVFFDIGSVWGLEETGGANVLYEDFTARSVVGFSIFWSTPIGPLRFNFTEALEFEEFDRPQNFDLTISTTF